MDSEKTKRQNTIKRSRTKSAAIIITCILIFTVIAAIVAFNALSQDNYRVFSGIGTSVTLHEDGTFLANLPHDVIKRGTYEEVITVGATTVLFSCSEKTVSGSISSSVMTLPSEWEPECACWHNLRLRLR